MQPRLISFRRWCLAVVSGAVALSWAGLVPGAEAATNLPTIIRPPLSGSAATNEGFVFTVEATSPAPMWYQWRLAGTNLPGATGTALRLNRLTQSQGGYYSVQVANTNGKVVSSRAWLNIGTPFPRRLTIGRILNIDTSTPAVPIVLRANGLENAVSFTLSYNTNQLSNPVFIPGFSAATATVNNDQPGRIGVVLAMTNSAAFPPGYITLGAVQFEARSINSALAAGLAFVSDPAPLAASNAAGQALSLSSGIEPQFVLLDRFPALDLQSGLFKQRMYVYNPGARTITNINIVPQTLGRDPLRNAILLYNGIDTLTNYPHRDPLVDITRDCGCGYVGAEGSGCSLTDYLACANAGNNALDASTTNIHLSLAQIYYLAPGEPRPVTMEYYVSDHRTVPPATYSLYATDVSRYGYPVSDFTYVNITTNRFINGAFLIEFPTKTGYRYFIEYDEMPQFQNFLVALPPVEGTGNRVQWIDDGPPKTFSPPENGSRFYRIRERK